MKQIITACLVALATPLAAQTNIDLGGLRADPEASVEITADSLNVDQASETAIFEGNVLIGQGDLRISAGRVQVVYSEETGDIAQLEASGGVTFITETEAAEAENASYDLTSGTLTLNGDVLLTQGASALSADQMVVNLDSGNARMTGRVRTTFSQDGN
jgi:lipopolysaccharide export system protein LptA